MIEKKEIQLPKRYRVDETFRDDNKLYTLFKDRKGNFAIVTADALNFEVFKVEGQIPKKSRIRDMAVLGDYAYFNSYIKNEPYLFSVNWKTGKQKPIIVSIKGFNSKEIQLDNFQLLEETGEVMLYVSAKLSKKAQDTYVIQLDENGKKKELYNLTKSIDENIIDGSALKLQDGSYIFTGTYSNTSRFTSQGIYFCKSKGSTIDFIEFHKFLDLDNFLSYLPERRQEKIERKRDRKEAKGKEVNINYRIAAHDIVEREDGYVLLGEAYYPTYRSEPVTTTNMVNGVAQTVTTYNTVFDGYRYTHAVIAKFDFNGQLKWDQTFELWPTYKPYFVKRFITIEESEQEDLKMVFASRNRLVTEIIDENGEIVKELKTEPIETNFEGDKTKWSFSNIDHWYKDTFIAYGSQKIKNKTDDKVKKKRKVYFISKIRFQ